MYNDRKPRCGAPPNCESAEKVTVGDSLACSTAEKVSTWCLFSSDVVDEMLTCQFLHCTLLERDSAVLDAGAHLRRLVDQMWRCALDVCLHVDYVLQHHKSRGDRRVPQFAGRHQQRSVSSRATEYGDHGTQCFLCCSFIGTCKACAICNESTSFGAKTQSSALWTREYILPRREEEAASSPVRGTNVRRHWQRWMHHKRAVSAVPSWRSFVWTSGERMLTNSSCSSRLCVARAVDSGIQYIEGVTCSST